MFGHPRLIWEQKIFRAHSISFIIMNFFIILFYFKFIIKKLFLFIFLLNFGLLDAGFIIRKIIIANKRKHATFGLFAF